MLVNTTTRNASDDPGLQKHRLPRSDMKYWGGKMDIKRLIIGSITGLVVLYVVGYVIWEMLLVDFFAANAGSAQGVAREEQILWAVLVGTLCYATLLTMTIEARSGATSLVDGAKAGAVVGLLLWGTVDFLFYGYFNLNNLTGAIADIVLEGVRGGIGGAVIALVLGKLGD